jgi:hypothetical protein
MHKDKFSSFLYGCSCCRVAVGLAILVSIFRNLGSIDINNLNLRINFNGYKFNFTLISSFLGFLFNVFFGKVSDQIASGIIGTLTVALSFAVSVYFSSK